MVEFEDGAVIAQMASPDMREPIQFAIGFPERLPLSNRKLDFAKLGSISFFEPDLDKFPALGLAYKAIERGGNIPCVLNAANESAVAAYLRDEIPFYGISDIVGECMEKATYIAEPTIEDIFETNRQTRAAADLLIMSSFKKS
jgi:1-deoxy-D-xylulose-5-phosphate reductoisomerase